MSVYTARRITLGASVAITVDAFGAIFDSAGVAQVCRCPLFSILLFSPFLPTPFPHHHATRPKHLTSPTLNRFSTQFQMFTACGTKADVFSPTVYYGRTADAPSVDDCMLQYANSIGASLSWAPLPGPFSLPRSVGNRSFRQCVDPIPLHPLQCNKTGANRPLGPLNCYCAGPFSGTITSTASTRNTDSTGTSGSGNSYCALLQVGPLSLSPEPYHARPRRALPRPA